VIILPEVPAAGALVAAERIRACIAASPVTFKQTNIAVTVSLGVAENGKSSPSPESLLGEADQALYASKENGRNRVTLRQPGRQPTRETTREC
jgi:diguanylate cyclase (GGDEF)-like protein